MSLETTEAQKQLEASRKATSRTPLSDMTDEELAALPAATLARLRGDTV